MTTKPIRHIVPETSAAVLKLFSEEGLTKTEAIYVLHSVESTIRNRSDEHSRQVMISELMKKVNQSNH